MNEKLNLFNYFLELTIWVLTWNLITLLISRLNIKKKHNVFFYVLSIILLLIIMYSINKSFVLLSGSL